MKRAILWKDIVAVLAMKLVLLFGLYFAFFSPSHRVVATASTVTDRLFGTDHR